MTVKKRGLGRGLNNFVKDSVKIEELLQTEEEKQDMISVDEIFPNPDQPRKNFEIESLEELANSIKEYGILQPLVLRRVEKGYEIVAGERRFRSAKLAGLTEVPAVVREINQELADKISLIENIQREDLNPMEEAIAYQNIMKNYEMTQENLAKALGKSRSYIANTTRLLKLDKRVQEFLADEKLSISHGKLLLQIKNPEEQYDKAKKIIREGSTVKETVTILSPKKKKVEKDVFIKDIEERLTETLGTKVELQKKGKRKKIEIEYYTDDDLERILEIIIGEI